MRAIALLLLFAGIGCNRTPVTDHGKPGPNGESAWVGFDRIKGYADGGDIDRLWESLTPASQRRVTAWWKDGGRPPGRSAGKPANDRAAAVELVRTRVTGGEIQGVWQRHNSATVTLNPYPGEPSLVALPGGGYKCFYWRAMTIEVVRSEGVWKLDLTRTPELFE